MLDLSRPPCKPTDAVITRFAAKRWGELAYLSLSGCNDLSDASLKVRVRVAALQPLSIARCLARVVGAGALLACCAAYSFWECSWYPLVVEAARAATALRTQVMVFQVQSRIA